MTRAWQLAAALLLAACGAAIDGDVSDDVAEREPESQIAAARDAAAARRAEREAERNAELRSAPAEIVECGADECGACRDDLRQAGIPSREARCEARRCESDADCASLASGAVCADPGGAQPTAERLCRQPRRGLDYSCEPELDAPDAPQCETGLQCACAGIDCAVPRCRPAAD